MPTIAGSVPYEKERIMTGESKPVTVSGILGVVFGGIALLTSFIPIVNNASVS